MAKNGPKPYNVTTSNVFLSQKWTKRQKTRIFLDTTLAFDDSNQLSPVSDQVLDKSDVRIRRKCPNTRFLSENCQILDQKGSKNGPIFLSEQKFSLTTFKQ